MDLFLSVHARNVLKERNIPEEWVERAVSNPDWEDTARDDNMHYFKRIDEHGGRVLHVVVNHKFSPQKIITVFFDRRAGR